MKFGTADLDQLGILEIFLKLSGEFCARAAVLIAIIRT